MGEAPSNSNERQRETAVVVARIDSGDDIESSLEEMHELLRTAGVDVVGTIGQQRDRPHLKTYLGSGKTDELVQLVRHLEPDVVVFDDELLPSQQRNIEDEVKRRVLDRTAVILDIFAAHAHTAEGKLQVEVAQLSYNMSRMRGLWTHLERLGGGVGTRGPGESQLETDRRLARKRVSMLRAKLKEVTAQRGVRRARRQDSVVPKVALAGYTNAGKSTLLNALTGAEVSSADRLFETLDATTRGYDTGGRRYLITDTVGFIERLPHQLVQAFGSTLEETLLSDMIVLVTDASLDEVARRAQLEAVRDVLGQIGAGDLPTLVALNKCDRLSPADRERVLARHPDAVLLSAKTGEGLSDLTDRIAEAFADRFEQVSLLIPYTEAGIISELYDAGAPVQRRDTEHGIEADAHLPKSLLGRVARYRVPAGATVASGGTASSSPQPQEDEA